LGREKLFNNKNMNRNQIIALVLVGGITFASTIEMNKHEHVHEGTYETTHIVQTCVPFVTGSYSSVLTGVLNTDWFNNLSGSM
jgi:hypothetical protein